MFDGGNLDAKICEEDAISFIIKFQLKSDYVKGDSEANFQYKEHHNGIQISVRYKDGSYVLYIGGSIHKFHQGDNIKDFPFSEVSRAKDSLKKALSINGSTIRINDNSKLYYQPIPAINLKFKSLEVGVNVEIMVLPIVRTEKSLISDTKHSQT